MNDWQDKAQKNYFKLIKERGGQSRVYVKHQWIGLLLAQMLEDEKHKSLYMKLAKKYSEEKLFNLAKSIAENKKIKNKGAYFMKVWHEKYTNQ